MPRPSAPKPTILPPQRVETVFKTLHVAIREFLATVLTRGFIIGIFLPPAIIATVIPVTMALMGGTPKVTGHVAIIDRSGVTADRIKDQLSPEKIAERNRKKLEQLGQKLDEQMNSMPLPPGAKEQANQQIKMSGMLSQPDLRVTVLPNDADIEKEKSEILKAIGKEKDAAGADPRLLLAVIPESAIKPAADGTYSNYEIFTAPKLDVAVQSDIERAINTAIVDTRLVGMGMDVEKIRSVIKTPDPDAKAVTASGDKATNEAAKMLVPGAFMFLLWISVFTCGQYLLTSTIEEKSSRVMEVVLSAVSPMQLMVGKILGQMAVGSLILAVYAGMGIVGLISAAMVHVIDPINLLYLAVYFVLAFFMIASMMAAVGSAVSDIREAQSLMSPIMIVLMIPMMLWMPILRNPNSTFAQICSFIPPINPFVMILRLSGSEKVPTWQIPASIFVAACGAVFMAWAASKIFRIGVLMYGKPPNFKTLIRWIRMA